MMETSKSVNLDFKHFPLLDSFSSAKSTCARDVRAAIKVGVAFT